MPSKKYYFLQVSEEKFFENPRVNALLMENPQFVISLQRLILKANKSNEPGQLLFDEAFCSMEEQISAMLSCSLEYAVSFFKACCRRKLFEQNSLGIAIPIAKELTASRTDRADDMKERRMSEKAAPEPQIGFDQDNTSTSTITSDNGAKTDDHKMFTMCEKCSPENKDYSLESINQNKQKEEDSFSTKKKSRKGRKKSDASSESSAVKSICQKIVGCLNNITGRSFKSSTKDTQRLINARLNEGFKEEDFISVIKVKASQWLNNTKMARYLRPQTLFGDKMDAYLQEAKAMACLPLTTVSSTGQMEKCDFGDHILVDDGSRIEDTLDRTSMGF